MNGRPLQKILLAIIGTVALSFPVWSSINSAGAAAPSGCDPTNPPSCAPTALPSDAPAFPADIATGCANVGTQGIGCEFTLGDSTIIAGGLQTGTHVGPQSAATHAVAHKAAMRSSGAFVIDIQEVDPITGPARLIDRCTGEIGCLRTTSAEDIALGTTIRCTLVSATGPAVIGCGSPNVTTSVPVPNPTGSELPSAPPSGLPSAPPSGLPSAPPSGLPSAPPSGAPVPGWAGHVCLATDGAPCSIQAGTASDDVAVGGTTILTGRGSWLASGDWEIDVFWTGSCTGTPNRVYTGAANNNDPTGQHIGGSNNGGGFYGSCISAKATGPNSFVLLGAGASPLLP